MADDTNMNGEDRPQQVADPIEVIRTAAYIGAGTAIPGLFTGATYGTLRTATPILWSLVTGLQWFTLGSTFYLYRHALLCPTPLRNFYLSTRGLPLHPTPASELHPTPSSRTRASTLAGALTGFSLGWIRGPRNVIPGTIMFSLFGYVGQKGMNWADGAASGVSEREEERRVRGERKVGWVERVMGGKWSPMRVLSEEEYGRLMGEKILAVEAEVALVEERIEGVRRERERARMEEERVKKERGEGAKGAEAVKK